MQTTELIAKVRQIELRTRRLVSESLSGNYTSAFRGQGMEFSEVREYIPGDDIRSIDWNVTARAGTPFIKRFVEERELCLFFLVDLSGSMAFGSAAERKRETAAQFAAALSFVAARNHDKVGLATCTDTIEKFIPPKKGRGHTLLVIREILAASARGRGTNLQQGIEHAMRVLRKHTIIFLISDFLDTGYERHLSRLGRKHDVIAVPVRDPLELTLPSAGLVDVLDPETGARGLLDTSNRAHVAAYAQRMQHVQSQQQALFRQCGIDQLPIHTDGGFVDALVRFFHQREKRYLRS